VELELRAEFMIDATGPRGFLHQAFDLKKAPLPGYPATSALYSHFTGVRNFAGAQQYAAGGPPYPPDAAALHHVFDGGWMWMLHFNNGWTSAGFAASRAVAEQLYFHKKEAAWKQLLDALPEVKEQFAFAKPARPFTFVPQLSFRSAQIAGQGWAMLPSAAGFVDPLLSTGFPLTLLGVLRVGEILERDWSTSRLENSLVQYAAETDGELQATAELIAALYANMGDFPIFRTLSLLYFAAASYAETARRLERPHLAKSFLLHTDPVFGPEFRRITTRARQTLTVEEKRTLQDQIFSLIESFDVAGLCKRPIDHCYPVQADDLFKGAHKLQASVQDIEDLLRRTGFYTAAS
jgi:FADH2 O2-dependent halogenase